MDHRFYELVKQTLPESLEEFYQLADSYWQEDTDLQTALAKYGEYVFCEIRHAKKMHKLIID